MMRNFPLSLNPVIYDLKTMKKYKNLSVPTERVHREAVQCLCPISGNQSLLLLAANALGQPPKSLCKYQMASLPRRRWTGRLCCGAPTLSPRSGP